MKTLTQYLIILGTDKFYGPFDKPTKDELVTKLKDASIPYDVACPANKERFLEDEFNEFYD